MVVGFINGSLMTLAQGLGVVIGANLGTTITSQLFSFETGFLIMPLIVAGTALYFLEILAGRPLGGKVLLGVAAVLCGLRLLAFTLEPLAGTAAFHHLFAFSRGGLWRGIITGTMAAAIIQSSSVTIGMVILMVREGYLGFQEALAIVVGADLGTCLTAMLASIGTISPARKVAYGHLFFNLTSILLVILFWKPFLRAAEITSSDIARQLANSHALYNLLGAVVFLPLVDKYAIILQNIGGWQKGRGARRKKVGI
jgi:phosphate:Na+ symporter